MGLTHQKLTVKPSHDSRRKAEVKFLVDSGAVYSLVPSPVLKHLGIRPHRKVDFTLADGTTIVRHVGDAFFELHGEGGAAPVIFGEEGDEPLLGATTLESLRLVLDPFKRRLIPMRMLLAGCLQQVRERSKSWLQFLALIGLLWPWSVTAQSGVSASQPRPRRTAVSIVGDEFHINGKPTYEGRAWNGKKVQGLLFNSRMVQGIFDDRNAETARRWAYPDTGKWNPERNTREFLAAMPEWRRHGLIAFTIDLQGGSPEGYSKDQPWHNSAIESDGALRPDYMGRLERILDRADELGMVAILGCFYFGQDQRLQDESAVLRAIDNATRWLFERGYRNVLVEINNECNVRYDHDILKPDRVHELIERVKKTTRDGQRFLVSTSYGGGTVVKENVARTADFILMHGNGVSDPARLAEMVRQARKVPGYTPKPILFNEDDHFDFDKPKNNFVAALGEYASWGFFDPGRNDYVNGFQSPPVNWGLNTERKRAFFSLLAEITGSAP